ncbi:hypothetical protein CUMW_284150 [Citrus unshiu]|uniref:Uncharacterized protein n=1 Tax=Citrus unshiu TaxID=55188 RepID=A0A2H5MZL9_CITUN|nr:hypothetical protein CUMW_284150 [Citrus unshiu]
MIHYIIIKKFLVCQDSVSLVYRYCKQAWNSMARCFMKAVSFRFCAFDSLRCLQGNEIANILDRALQVELKSYGVIVNSFHGLESTYSEHYRKVMGGKVWHFGPVSLSNRYAKDKTQKTNTAASKECLR